MVFNDKSRNVIPDRNLTKSCSLIQRATAGPTMLSNFSSLFAKSAYLLIAISLEPLQSFPVVGALIHSIK